MSPREQRPAGSLDTRRAILTAIRTAFAHGSYQTFLRGITYDVGVDPVLVHHYFPDRATPFVEAVVESTTGVDANLIHRAASITELEPGHLGEGVVRTLIGLWDDTGADRSTAIIHAALGQDSDIEPFHDFIAIGILSLIVTHFYLDHPQLRVQFIASQIIGPDLARQVIHMGHIASPNVEALVALIGSTIQCCVSDDLPGLADPA